MPQPDRRRSMDDPAAEATEEEPIASDVRRSGKARCDLCREHVDRIAAGRESFPGTLRIFMHLAFGRGAASLYRRRPGA
jgi:hypothetical protein